ncbi:hypothetical protein DSO57_1016912 [Entomophthora muscae]|uniref:Uncharacterized protein n=1 Tax=Entomophthora muscae TaxID=34485 RepID=A0ACC2U328_9FUNG|nr:hypothetical protein DSO57_1016912 [Entomophthora muscae]
MVGQVFAEYQKLDQVPSRFKAVQVADSCRVAITHETVPFFVRMGNIQVKFFGPIMVGLSHDVIAGLDWLCHNFPYIDWDTSVITLNRNGVGFQIYPVEMIEVICAEPSAVPPVAFGSRGQHPGGHGGKSLLQKI